MVLEEIEVRRLVLYLALGGAAMRIALAPVIGLSVDESYAVVMSRHLALSYFDHPPLLFWIPGVMARLSGSEAQFIVRFPFIGMFAGTTWNTYRVGSILFSESAGFWGAVLLNLTLFFGINASTLVLPDGPLLFFSSCALLCLAKAVTAQEARTPHLVWLGFGLFSGLSLLSKYHAVFLFFGLAVFLATSPRHRRLLRGPGPYISLGIAIAVFLPVLLWNTTHGWASFRFQGGRAVPLDPENDTPFLGSIAGQAAWILPWVWIPLLVALGSALRKGPREPPRWLLACLGVGPIVVFTAVTAFGRRGLPHWQALGYFMLFPLLGASVDDRLRRGEPWVRTWLRGSAVAFVMVLAIFVTQARTGWIGRTFPMLLERGDPTVDLISWKPLVGQLRRWGYPKPELAVCGATWVDAAKLGYALGPDVPIGSIGGDPRGFEFVSSQASYVGRDVLLVSSRRPGFMEPMISYAPYFRRIVPIGTVPIRRHGSEEVSIGVYLGEYFLRPMPPTTRVR